MVKVSFDEVTYESRLETGRKAEHGRERKTGSEKEVKEKRKEIDVEHKRYPDQELEDIQNEIMR
jgi:hypothetical protein